MTASLRTLKAFSVNESLWYLDFIFKRSLEMLILTAIREAFPSNGLRIALSFVTRQLMSPLWQLDKRLSCGPPCPLSYFKYATWVPTRTRGQLTKLLAKALSTIREELHVGQVGLLFGKGALPLQEQHRDNLHYHVVFLMRCTRAAQSETRSYICRLGCAVTKAPHCLAVVRQLGALL